MDTKPLERFATQARRDFLAAVPFMFEREGDYTELLVPIGLLADGVLLSRTREVLTEEQGSPCD